MNSLQIPWGYVVLLCLLLCGCSSAPQKRYEVQTYKRIGHLFMTQADRKRQLGEFDQALRLYQKAIDYSQKRNDINQVGLARLKSAAIYIETGQTAKAQGQIEQVAAIVAFEQSSDLAQPLTFIQAKLAYHLGDVTRAVDKLNTLERHYQSQPAKAIYYKWLGWQYQHILPVKAQLNADMQLLESLKAQRALDNIEIYSYAVLQYARWLNQDDDLQTPVAIERALGHFSSLELSGKIAECYRLLAAFYAKQGQVDRSQYYKQKAERLKRPVKG